MTDDKITSWWESGGGFFGDLYKEADDSFEGHLNSPQDLSDRTKKEINGVMTLCGLKQGDSLLDCPSGYGRHSLALARSDLNVTGADINKKFLEISRKNLEDLKLTNCQFIEKDMRELDFKDRFDAVINMFYSFGFFDSDEENFKVLQNFYNALKPGGRFLMHTHVTIPRLVSGELKNHQVRSLKSGRKLELYRRYNEKTKREDGEWYVIAEDGSKTKLTPYSVRIYSEEEFRNLCIKAGFKDVKSYGDWDGIKYEERSPHLIVVATK